jgi:hypothetical protein
MPRKQAKEKGTKKKVSACFCICVHAVEFVFKLSLFSGAPVVPGKESGSVECF